MLKASEEKVKFARNIALIGIVIMGIGSFMSCLSESSTMSNIGVGLLVFSLIMTTYGFTYWRP